MENPDSILDRIIESKEIEEIEQFRPQETVETLLKYLTSREKDVLRRRFGLSGNKSETLEKIGEGYKVTRERIRQIETIAIKKLRNLKQFNELLASVIQTITSVLQRHGGIMREEFLLKELLRLSGDTEEGRQCVVFLMEKIFKKTFVFKRQDKDYYDSWSVPNTNRPLIESSIRTLVEMLKSANKAMKLDEVVEEFKSQDFYKEHAYQLSDDTIQSYLDLSKHIEKNPFDEYGLKEWPSIVPKRMNDKIYLVLKKNKKPMHFNEITEMINKLQFDDRPAYPPTVHNELILNNEYVLVGRGIYALKEWGYKPGVVADVIVEILKKSEKPLNREAIVEQVLKQRLVKKNTIHLALTDKHRFRKMSDNSYSLIQI